MMVVYSENVRKYTHSEFNNDIIGLSPVFGELLQGAKNNNERSIITDFSNNIYKIKEDDLFIYAGAESSRSKWLDQGVGLIA